MDYNQFMKYMEAGNETGKETVNALQDFVKEFPFFQSAHILLAKSMHDIQHVRYEKQLKIASAYAGDRNVLYDLINFKKEKSVHETKSESIFIPVQSIEVIEKENIPAEDIVEAAPVPVIKSEYPPPVISVSQPQHIIFEEDENMEEPPIDFDEPPVADPHDIIRKRLVEILGLANDKKESTPDFRKTFKKPQPAAEEEIKPEVTSVPLSQSPVAEKEILSSNIEELQESVEEKQESETDVIEKLAEESSKAVDFIQTAEIEYALENSIIQSLERLPVLEPVIKTETIDQDKEISEETHSFFDWLKLKPVLGYGYVEEVHAYDEEADHENLTPEVENSGKKSDSINELIDRFIETDPRIIPSKTEFYSPSTQAKRSITENDDVVSETLAKIYFQQGNLLKARTSYEKLSLYYPEKMAYFAALISEIDKALSNQDKQNL